MRLSGSSCNSIGFALTGRSCPIMSHGFRKVAFFQMMYGRLYEYRGQYTIVIWACGCVSEVLLDWYFFGLKSCFVKLSQLNSGAERNNIHFKAVQYNISAAHWCLANECFCTRKHIDWTIEGSRVSTFWDVFIWSTWGPPTYPVHDLPLS